MDVNLYIERRVFGICDSNYKVKYIWLVAKMIIICSKIKNFFLSMCTLKNL